MNEIGMLSRLLDRAIDAASRAYVERDRDLFSRLNVKVGMLFEECGAALEREGQFIRVR